jgi:hypothetical protein
MQTYTKLVTIGTLVFCIIFGSVARLDALTDRAAATALATALTRATMHRAPAPHVPAAPTAAAHTVALATSPNAAAPAEMTQAELAEIVGGGFWSMLRDVAIWVVEAAIVVTAVAGLGWLCSQPNVNCS